LSRRLLLIGGLAVLIGAGLAASIAVPASKKIEKHGPATPQSVAAVIPGGIDEATQAIRDTFNNWADLDIHRPPGTPRTYKSKFPFQSQWDHFYLFRKNDPVFPSDEDILLTGKTNPLVKRYVQIPPALRVHDLYLNEPSYEYWWASEYFADGEPAKFRCAFLIHIEPASETSTQVEIFEYHPTLWAGETIGFSAHSLPVPTTLHDIRPVDATTSDRAQVLQMIQDAAAKRHRG
jgi:hypothetical protein